MELLLLAASIIITGMVFLWLVRVIKATLRTALLIAAIVFALQFFGIGSDRILAQMQQIFQSLWRLIPGQQSFNLDRAVYQITQAAQSILEQFSS
ncbi:hypothetical protein [Leptolyngbya sp. NIES-2104]|uniref:hypothetical protein n=1 Tax=Leptolyngbya sp. NIES-2104 TaxID=1552121 RepID=UPI0006EC7F1B|nr:hypothetical protein [Leptolyngbya sp. NIES-2104]GAP98638.1 hypothetical protein NIES2104_51930 [Leptolyngbya sp. NIES-2104]